MGSISKVGYCILVPDSCLVLHDVMVVGTGGQLPPPPIFCQPKKFKIIKSTTYKSVYRNMAKYINSSVDIGNHSYTNEQNCILLKESVIKKFFVLPPPPNPKIVPTALDV